MIFVGRALTSCTEREGGTAKGRDGRRKRERRKRGGEDARDQARQGTLRSLLHIYIHTCIYTYIILINIDYFSNLSRLLCLARGLSGAQNREISQGYIITLTVSLIIVY